MLTLSAMCRGQALRAFAVLLLSSFCFHESALGAAESQKIADVEIDGLPLLGPYLLPTETPFESIRVAFRGTEDKTVSADGVLSYGLKAADEKELAFKAAPKHVLELKGLEPDSEYQYQLKLGDYQSPVYRFRTWPKPGARAKQMKIVLFADFHCHSPQDVAANEKGAENFFRRYAMAMADIKKFAPDFILLAGDTVQEGNRRAEYETFFRLLRETCARAIFLPCPGNHESSADKDLAIYQDYFPSPKNGSAAWAAAYGGIGFMAQGSGPWLKEAIGKLKKEGGADTLIYVRHHPVYQWADKGVVTGLKGTTDIFDAEGDVRLCFFGHRHMHQRTYPLLSEGTGKATSAEKSEYGPEAKGTIYMQVPSMWYQFAVPQDNPLVACNGKPSAEGSYTGYTEITITPEAIVTETYAYNKNVKHDRIDQFKILRRK